MTILVIWENHLNTFDYRYMLTLKIRANITYKKEINQKHIKIVLSLSPDEKTIERY